MVNVFSAIALASVAVVASVSAVEDDVRHLQAVNFRQEMLDAVNAARKKEGLDEVCINELLMNAAQVQANDMAENNFIKSTGSDGSVPKERATAEGFEAAQVTEVVGAGYRSASTIVSAWVKAASAKGTVLSKHTVMGPGYSFDKTKKYVHFWAVDFSDGECGNGTATAAAGSTSGSAELSTSSSGSAETLASSSGSTPASGSAETSTSGSAAETSTSGSAAETSTSGSAAETSASGSAAETPASGSAAETSTSGSAVEASSSGAAETPASGSAETPASGSGEETPASETSSASAEETEAPAEETEAPDTPNQ